MPRTKAGAIHGAARDVLVVCALAVATYAVTLGNGFVYDDKHAVLNNPIVQGQVSPTTVLSRGYWGLGVGLGVSTWRPLAVLSFWLDWRLGSGAAWMFHLSNVAMHAATAVAWLFAVRHQLNDARVALASAALFAVMPVGSDAVASIVGRADVMAAGLCFFAWWALGPLPDTTSARRGAAACIAFALALMAKESAIAFPLWVFAVDALRVREWRTLVRAWPRYAALVAVATGVLVLRALVYEPPYLGVDPFDNPLADAPFPTRLWTSFHLLVLSLRQILVPLWLSPDHSYAQIVPATSPLSPGALLGAAALGMLLVSAWKLRRTWPAWTAGVAVFVGSWLVVSNVALVLPTIFAERLLYLPSAGVALAVGSLFVGPSRWRNLALAGICAVSALATAFVAQSWKDEETLFARAVENAPSSARAWNNYGAALMDTGRPLEAIPKLERAVAIAPSRHEPREMLGRVLFGLGRVAEAEQMLREAVRLKPDHEQSVFNLAVLLANTNRLREAHDLLAPFVRDNPQHERAALLLGQMEADLARRR